MSKIRIKNFGPIKEGFQENGGFIDLEKVTVFIGNQGSGKSTVAKVIASMVWLEKALNRGDFPEPPAILNYFHQLFGYLRLGKEYFGDDTEIEYVGNVYTIRYVPRDQYPMIKRVVHGRYQVPKIMYIPSERNFLSVVQNAYDVKGLPRSLFEFAEEFRRSQKELKGEELSLPIPGYRYVYNEREDKSFVVGSNHKVDLLEASSGFQSIIPLIVVSNNLANLIMTTPNQGNPSLTVDQSLRMNEEISIVMQDNSLSPDEKLKEMEIIRAKYKNEVFINIVEEAEQNLYPISQKQVLYELLRFNNMNDGNRLVLTTHSPYLINYLTLAVEASRFRDKRIPKKHQEEVENIVPQSATILPGDLAIYELNGDGTIKLLENYKGLPSDENLLNEELGEGNDQFSKLLEIEIVSSKAKKSSK